MANYGFMRWNRKNKRLLNANKKRHYDYVNEVIIISVENGERLYKGDKWHPTAQELLKSGIGVIKTE